MDGWDHARDGKEKAQYQRGNLGAKSLFSRGRLKFIEMSEEGESWLSTSLRPVRTILLLSPKLGIGSKPWQMIWSGIWVYCRPEDYFPKKYGSNPVHSEVLEAMQNSPARRALDLGLWSRPQCSSVAGLLKWRPWSNEPALEILRSIVEQEDLDLPVGSYDINLANWPDLWFDRFHRCPYVPAGKSEFGYYPKYANITALGGYNLIVCAMDTRRLMLCSLSFYV